MRWATCKACLRKATGLLLWKSSGVVFIVNTRAAYHNRSISPQEQALYDHFLAFAESETPQQLLDRFKGLFIEGGSNPDHPVTQTLDELLTTGEIEHYFHYVLNRCCHILINRWQRRSQQQCFIPELVELLAQGSANQTTDYSRSRQVRLLRGMVSEFTQTEQYLTLKRLALLINESEKTTREGNQPLGTLIQRYPYLYEHYTVNEDSPEEHQQNIRRIRQEAQRKYEINLSQYVTYRVRRSRLQKQAATPEQLQRLRPIENPTLLSDRDLVASLNQFSGAINNGRNYSDSAQIFLQQNQSVKFHQFKRDLYYHLTSSVTPSYGGHKFNKLLERQLIQTLPENEDAPLNDFLLVRTCSQLLSFLVVDSPQQLHHYVFIDLINNIGPLATTGLLLKIVLLCKRIKPYLESRFSILFSHYEAATQNSVSWLVEMLENVNVAFSLVFGSVDVSALMNSHPMNTQTKVPKLRNTPFRNLQPS